jgi:hypothetical protein
VSFVLRATTLPLNGIVAVSRTRRHSTGDGLVERNPTMPIVPRPVASGSRNGDRAAAEHVRWIGIDQGYRETVFIDGRLSSGYMLAHPIRIDVWIEAGKFVADAPDLNVHSFGEDRDAAIANLCRLLVTHFERLDRRGDMLSPKMAEDRDRLRRVLVARHAQL